VSTNPYPYPKPEQHDYDGQRSKVKVTVNARGGIQWELSVLVGEDEEAVDKARGIAVRMHRALEEEFRIRAAEAS
jgi:hypothetical protein